MLHKVLPFGQPVGASINATFRRYLYRQIEKNGTSFLCPRIFFLSSMRLFLVQMGTQIAPLPWGGLYRFCKRFVRHVICFFAESKAWV